MTGKRNQKFRPNLEILTWHNETVSAVDVGLRATIADWLLQCKAVLWLVLLTNLSPSYFYALCSFMVALGCHKHRDDDSKTRCVGNIPTAQPHHTEDTLSLLRLPSNSHAGGLQNTILGPQLTTWTCPILKTHRRHLPLGLLKLPLPRPLMMASHVVPRRHVSWSSEKTRLSSVWMRCRRSWKMLKPWNPKRERNVDDPAISSDGPKTMSGCALASQRRRSSHPGGICM